MRTTVYGRTLLDAAVPRQRMTDFGFVVGASLLVALGARVAIPLPFTPVPITAQTLMVLLAGALLGWKRGGLAMMAYIAEGAAGLPVFAGGHSGIAWLVGPTGGYLLSYPLAAALTGWLAERGWDRHIVGSAAAMLLGNIVIYLIGVPWLAHQKVLPASIAMQGVLPFLPGDLVKVLVATIVLPGGWSLIGKDRKLQS
ncbi:MAG: biotin transporter BioY [Herpetosiphon sp.]